MRINLKLDHIFQIYNQGQTKVKVFDDLNLLVKKSEIIGIIGPSGSGKSTLLNLIGLLENPHSGTVNISGIECSKMKNEDKVNFRKQNISFILGNLHFYNIQKYSEEISLS